MPRKGKNQHSRPLGDLTPKQVAFAVAYAGNGNATESAKIAGYSAKSAAVTGCILTKNPKVAQLIENERAERWNRLKMSGDEVLARAALLARSNIKTVFKESGALVNPADLDELESYGIASVEAQLVFGDDGAPPEEIRKIKMRDPMPALRLLAQHHKLIGAEVQVNITEELAERLQAARKRARVAA